MKHINRKTLNTYAGKAKGLKERIQGTSGLKGNGAVFQTRTAPFNVFPAFL